MDLIVCYAMLCFFIIEEAMAVYCGDNIFCNAPYKCCENTETKNGCCYDTLVQTNRHLRLQVWNMWYFWFLFVFMMVSCFGGCGYYRRRRLAMMARSASAENRSTVLSPQWRSPRRGLGRGRAFNFFAFQGPDANPPAPMSDLPPAYSEVVSQPALYPANKIVLPPYPGVDKPEDSERGEFEHGQRFEQPPPSYFEYQSEQPTPPVSNAAWVVNAPIVPSQDNTESQPSYPPHASSQTSAH